MTTGILNPIHKFVGRGDFVDDWSLISFTTDGNYHDFPDMSGVVPANAKAVELKTYLKDDAPGQMADIRAKGHGIWHAGFKQQTQVANIAIYNFPIIEFNPAYPLQLEYRFADTVWSSITIGVISWRI